MSDVTIKITPSYPFNFRIDPDEESGEPQIVRLRIRRFNLEEGKKFNTGWAENQERPATRMIARKPDGDEQEKKRPGAQRRQKRIESGDRKSQRLSTRARRQRRISTTCPKLERTSESSSSRDSRVG